MQLSFKGRWDDACEVKFLHDEQASKMVEGTKDEAEGAPADSEW
jgi:hypothetical protein